MPLEQIKKMLNNGNNIIVTGIAFQVATMSVCGLQALGFGPAAWKHERYKVTTEKAETRLVQPMWWVFLAESVAHTCIVVQCIYR